MPVFVFTKLKVAKAAEHLQWFLDLPGKQTCGPSPRLIHEFLTYFLFHGRDRVPETCELSALSDCVSKLQ